MRRRELIRQSAWAGLGLAAGGVRTAPGATASALSGDDEAALVLGLFPLPMVAFPNELVLLHVYEPRYQALIEHCLASGEGFGIPTVIEHALARFGTEMHLERVLHRADSGEMDIAVRGARAFRLREFWPRLDDKPYPGGMVEPRPDVAQADPDVQSEVIQLYNRLHQLLGTGQALRGEAPLDLSFAIGHDVRLDVAGELTLLSMTREADRQRYLLEHLRRAVSRLQTLDSARAPTSVEAAGRILARAPP